MYRKTPRVALIESRPRSSFVSRFLQHLKARWFDVNDVGLELRRAQHLDGLVMRTEDANVARIDQAAHTLGIRPVQVAFVFAVLQKFPGCDIFFHQFPTDEVVFFPVDLAGFDGS